MHRGPRGVPTGAAERRVLVGEYAKIEGLDPNDVILQFYDSGEVWLDVGMTNGARQLLMIGHGGSITSDLGLTGLAIPATPQSLTDIFVGNWWDAWGTRSQAGLASINLGLDQYANGIGFDTTLGLLQAANGLLEYGASPVTGAFDAYVGRPFETLTGGSVPATFWGDSALTIAGAASLRPSGGLRGSAAGGVASRALTSAEEIVPLGPGWTVVAPRGLGAASGPLPEGYQMVSRWVNTEEVTLWTSNGGTAIPSGIGRESGRVFVTDFAAPRPAGGVGPIRLDFAVRAVSLNRAGVGYQIFQPVQSMPIYNFRVHVPEGVVVP